MRIVDGHRYADDPEPSWYSGAGQYARPTEPDRPVGNPYDSGVHERPSGAFRLPEQRPSYPLPDQVTSTGSHARQADPVITTGGHARQAEPDGRIPIRGPEYPTIRPTGEPAPPPAPEPASSMAEPTSLVPPVTAGGNRPDSRPESVYLSRRPATSFLVAIVMAILMIPVVRLLIDATFSGDPSARAIVPAVLLTLGFTLTGIGCSRWPAGARSAGRPGCARPWRTSRRG